MLPQPKAYIQAFPSYFSLKELTDLYFDNFAISYVSFTPREKKPYFGSIVGSTFVPKMEGRIIEKAWKELPKDFHNVKLGDYCVNTNEFCGIIMIDNRLSQENSRKYIPTAIASFKNRSTKLLNQFHGTHGRIFWDNFYKEVKIWDIETLRAALDSINIS